MPKQKEADIKIYANHTIFKGTVLNRLFAYSHSPIEVHFSKNSKDFVVSEIPLYEFKGEGEHLILHVRKKDMTTWEMLKAFSEQTGVKVKEFGYAGLKDKEGMTVQYISLPKKKEKEIDNFHHDKIKILDRKYHTNKLKIGHLKGNNFFIRLKKTNKADAKKIKNILSIFEKEGIANYFGYQRFGKEKNNFLTGREILEGKRRERNKKMRNFYISAYQSHLFNLWLSRRVEINKFFASFNEKELENVFDFNKDTIKQIKRQKSFCKLLPGDVLHHYPYGRVFLCNDTEEESERFMQKEITLTGVLPGKKAVRAEGLAAEIEKNFFGECEEYLDKMQGGRRFAWIWPQNIKSVYKEENAWFEFSFDLPKGSYATVLLEELTHKKN